MPGEAGLVKSRPAGETLQDQGDRLAGQPVGAHVAVSVDGTEHRPVGDLCVVQPALDRSDRVERRDPSRHGDETAVALLVGLGSSDRHHQAFGDELQVVDVQGDELGSPQPGGEAEQEQLAINQPRLYSTLRTSISPNIIKGGYLRNVIPSEAEATLDIRAVPGEDMEQLLDRLRRLVDDPAVEFEKIQPQATRPGAPPSRLDSEAFRVIEEAYRQIYNAPTLPTMMTGGTDMAYLRARGVQCYGIGPLLDSEDGPRGFGAHSDQERILEEAFHLFIRFQYSVVVELAAVRR